MSSTGFGASHEELAAQVLASLPADESYTEGAGHTTSAVQLAIDLLNFYVFLAWFSLAQQVQRARCAAASWLAPSSPTDATQPLGVVRTDVQARALLQWAAASGITLARSLRLGAFEEALAHGVITTSDVTPGTVLVSVPSTLTLSVAEVATADEVPAAVGGGGQELCPEEDWYALPWYARLALLLLRERERGEASPLQPWIAALPEPPDVPMAWGEDELAELQVWRRERAHGMSPTGWLVTLCLWCDE